MTTQLRYENDEGDLFTNKSTMMANFEKWIKLATDNKINSRNSWNFALIDYFYDLNILKDSEDNINFQKASATLDGCIKIYSSRVDSVSTETSKLLSGLAQKRKNKHNGDGKDGEDGEDGEDETSETEKDKDDIVIDPATGLPIARDDEDAHLRRRVYNRMLETTLVDFDTIRLKALDKELNIDPLFKKALVDFDEGGAKSLLLNTLNTNNSGRVVFDAAIQDTNFSANLNNDIEENEDDDNGEETSMNIEESRILENLKNQTPGKELAETDNANDSIVSTTNRLYDASLNMEDDILGLGMDFINFDSVIKSEISPAIQKLRNVVEDISKAKGFIDGINDRTEGFLNEQELKEALLDEDEIENDDQYDGQNDLGDMGDIGDMGDMDGMNDDINMNNSRMDMSVGEASILENRSLNDIDESSLIMNGLFEKDLMSYFDTNLRQTWRGRDHWKIRTFKKNNLMKSNENMTKNETNRNEDNTDVDIETTPKESKKTKKKLSEINFFEIDDNLENDIFTSKQRKLIEIPIKYRVNESHFLLPDDYHFSSDTLTSLFIKPKQKMSLFKNKNKNMHNTPNFGTSAVLNESNNNGAPELADEQFWADNYERNEKENITTNEENEIREVELDNPFDDDGIDFNQAFDIGGNPLEDIPIEDNDESKSTDNLILNNGLSNLQSNKVNYSRVTKKVDVKKLKNNIWKSISILLAQFKTDDTSTSDHKEIELRFIDIVKEIVPMYQKDALKEISTSFCFICLLHLCNDHGLSLKNTEFFEDLIVICNNN